MSSLIVKLNNRQLFIEPNEISRVTEVAVFNEEQLYPSKYRVIVAYVSMINGDPRWCSLMHVLEDKWLSLSYVELHGVLNKWKWKWSWKYKALCEET